MIEQAGRLPVTGSIPDGAIPQQHQRVELSLAPEATPDHAGAEFAEFARGSLASDDLVATRPIEGLPLLSSVEEVSPSPVDHTSVTAPEKPTVPEKARQLVGVVRAAGYAACIGAAGIELDHATNEGWRVTLLGDIQRHTGNSKLATLGATGLLFVTEFGAALGSTVILHSPRAKRMARWFTRRTVKPEDGSATPEISEAYGIAVNDLRTADPAVLEAPKPSRSLPKLPSVKKLIPEKVRSALVTGVQSVLIGTPSLLGRYHANDPDRTVSRDVRDGLVTSVALSAGLALPTYFAASAAGKIAAWEGRHSDEFTVGGLSAMALLGVFEVVKNRREERKEARQLERLPDYHLDPEKLAELEEEMVEEVRRRHGETLAAVWLPHDSPYANVARTHEYGYFTEFPDLMRPYEADSRFLTLVDARPGIDRVVHTTRISAVDEKDWQIGPMLPGQNREPKIAFMKDLDSSGQIPYGDIIEFYDLTGITLDSCTSVESNRRVGEWVPNFNDVSTTDLAYLTVYNYTADRVRVRGDSVHTTGIFAHLNAKSIESLGSVGVFWCPVAERPDLRTPTVSPDGSTEGVVFDDDYTPVFLPANEQNATLFDALRELTPPALELADRVPKTKTRQPRIVGRMAFAHG